MQRLNLPYSKSNETSNLKKNEYVYTLKWLSFTIKQVNTYFPVKENPLYYLKLNICTNVLLLKYYLHLLEFANIFLYAITLTVRPLVRMFATAQGENHDERM